MLTESKTWEILSSPNSNEMSRFYNERPHRRDVFGLLITGSMDFQNYRLLEAIADALLMSDGARNLDPVIVQGEIFGTGELALEYAARRGYECFGLTAGHRGYSVSDTEALHAYDLHSMLRPLRRSRCGCLYFWDGRSSSLALHVRLAKLFNTPIWVWDCLKNDWVRDLDAATKGMDTHIPYMDD